MRSGSRGRRRARDAWPRSRRAAPRAPWRAAAPPRPAPPWPARSARAPCAWRPLLADGGAEVATHGGGDKLDVLHGERAVEAEQRARVRDLLLGGALVDEEERRIAGETDEEEDDGDDAPGHEHRVQQAPEEESRHGRTDTPSRWRRRKFSDSCRRRL